ncbi:DotU family type IV/VI secretion system protein [Aquitalea sp. ASV11]|uniref:DotU family type IV/VI secretion system protein n=1 Tax=Aquitalea sp. ASV11 TaxID=2795103 RepID=UPI0018EB858B|nr:DotU/TssL family secretion system protein [Aquitalea sp. ASV11]
MSPLSILHAVRGNMRDIALIVTRLQQQAEPVTEHQLNQDCQHLLDQLEQALEQAGAPRAEREQIIYACCCLLDETALRHLPEPARAHWQARPLQVHRFASLQGGEQLYEQMRSELARPQPSYWLLACWQLVLALGFEGKYSQGDTAQHQQWRQQLDKVINALEPTQEAAPSPRPVWHWRSFSPWLWAMLSGLLLLVIYLLLQGWLHQALRQLGN